MKRHWRAALPYRWWWIILFSTTVALLAVGKKLDREIFGESIRDLYAQVTDAEDWRLAVPLKPALDYSWLETPMGKEVRVAHALGAAGTAAANTLLAATKAQVAGFLLLEVDIWLEPDSTLRCHHGPEAPQPDLGNACTLTRLLDSLKSHPRAKLILDIKTDFRESGERVLRVLDGTDPAATEQIVFQLYHPSHLQIFSVWAEHRPLPGPIVTAYLSPWSLARIEHELVRLNVKAFTFPLYRHSALGVSSEAGPRRLIHPVHDCDALAIARRLGAAGIYTLSDLDCK